MALTRMHDQPASHQLHGYEVGEQVGFLLRRAHQRHAALFQAGMAEFDLTPQQFTALVRLVEFGQLTQNHLGRLAAMDPATIQGVVRRLMLRGLVARAPDPRDRRATLLEPTPPGIALAARAVNAGRAITEATLAPLPAADRARFLRMLARVA